MIRLLGLEDRDAFRPLRQAALDSNPEAYATSGEDWRNAPNDKIEALLQTSVDGRLPMLGFFDPDLIGMIGLRREPGPTEQHKATLWGFFVMQAKQNHGVGRSLLEEAIRFAQAIPGLEMLTLVAATGNTAAIHLFEASGFQPCGTEPRARRVGDIYYDQVYLYRFLHETGAPVNEPSPVPF